MPQVSKDLACTIFEQLLEPIENNIPAIPSASRPKQAGSVDDTPAPARPPATDQADRPADRDPGALRHRRHAHADRAAGRWLMTPSRRARLVLARRRGAAADRRASSTAPTTCRCPASPVDADDAITVTAEFEDILNIVPKSPVMVDDVTVGEVTDVERVGWHAKITMLVRKDVDLPDNAIAEIRQVSLLGEKYVALEPPAEGASDGPARRRRQHPALRDRPQPRGRGGARRAVVPAQRWRRGPARHHHRGAQQGDGAGARRTCATCWPRSPTWSARSTTRRPTSSGRWSRSAT